MAKLLWDQVGTRFFEQGLDHGVLYLEDGAGIPWNGLVSITESIDDETTPVHIDGIKIRDLSVVGDFAATLNAFTYPDQFLEYEGSLEIGDGLQVELQPPKPFGLSYRTRVGNDVEGLDHGYKIHILYNLTAVPDTKGYATLSSDSNLSDFTWTLTAVPESYPGFKPTAHIILDTRLLHDYMIREIEAILYGDETHTARLPTITELAAFAQAWVKIQITDNGDGTWTATGDSDFISMTSPTSFEITEVNATYSDANTYSVSTTNA